MDGHSRNQLAGVGGPGRLDAGRHIGKHHAPHRLARFVCMPAPPVVDAFWPAFIVSLVLLGGLTWLALRSVSKRCHEQFR